MRPYQHFVAIGQYRLAMVGSVQATEVLVTPDFLISTDEANVIQVGMAQAPYSAQVTKDAAMTIREIAVT